MCFEFFFDKIILNIKLYESQLMTQVYEKKLNAI